MDTDFVITGPLHKWLDKLEDHDIVSYSDHGKTEDTACDGQYSSNFHASHRVLLTLAGYFALERYAWGVLGRDVCLDAHAFTCRPHGVQRCNGASTPLVVSECLLHLRSFSPFSGA
jgi:hypothetical protein